MNDNGHRRTISLNWAGLGDEDYDDRFFESCDRMSSVVAVDLCSSGSSSDEDEEFDDPRMSFVSAVSSVGEDYRSLSGARASTSSPTAPISQEDYNVWMAEPGSINERRKRLFHGMGFGLSNKQLLRLASAELQRAVSKKVGGNCQVSPLIVETTQGGEASKRDPSSTSPLPPTILVRSRSDGDIDFPSIAKRKEEFFGNTSKQRLARTSSNLLGACTRACRYPESVRVSPKEGNAASPFHHKGGLSTVLSNSRFGAIFLIKNLDTGKEFIVNEYDNEGMWNRLSDLQTGKQLTMEEFEKSVGYSPVVKELMRRENVSRMANYGIGGSERKLNTHSYLSKSLRMSKRSGVALLKNIKGVANSMSGLIGDRERESQHTSDQKPGKSTSPTPSSEWVRVRQHGKSYKELSALQLCQEIPAHEGSIWTIRFSLDGHYLASAGEDRVIHVWEVQECELMSMRPDEWSWTPLHPSASACNTPDRYESSGMMSPGPLSPAPSEKKKKGKGSQNGKKGIPDYVYVPETVFGLSDRPVCSFRGHLDDVLDLSWSRSQLLLSSSMDKTVRLWDLDTKSCLKLFAHNDYVTCIQFNPIDDRYFISGSLDSKVRIWNIPDRHVVDWTDIHEMVTAVCYTPDGEGAIIGSHKGSCRVYSAEDCKLTQSSVVEISNKKKSHAKKITGFQFSPWNPSEILITSADSRIRILDGSEVTHKFRGFRNTSSQIAASFTQDGKYLVCASEDSHVYVWKHHEGHHGKTKGVVNVRSYETFQCKDVSVAITWPGTVRGEPPPVTVHSKRHSRRSTLPPPSSSSAGSPPQEERENHHPGPIGASKRQLPPLPKKGNANAIERTPTPPEEDMAQLSRLDSGVGICDSFSSAAFSSVRYGSDSPSISAAANPSTASWSSSWSWFDGGNSNGAVQATAWGMVIVTAGLGGEIRAYQNFGIPRRVGRQANLFGT